MSVDFDRLKKIFLVAVEQYAPEEREAYLDRACGDDPQLRAQVSRLLAGHMGAARVHGPEAPELATSPPTLAQTGVNGATSWPPEETDGPPSWDDATVGTATTPRPQPATGPPLAEGPGSRIGPYRLLQQIGEGGMGAVFMAEQDRPVRRRVAMKVVKPGMDSALVLARFEAERQALALMEHPNIAGVLEAGVTDAGRPFFIMELVKGIPITQYCDDARLSPRERLELFVPVCQAIQHAHQKGIIHRDIKPSNVLVTEIDGRPLPKIIDFGIAKATGQRLTERTLFTQFGSIVGTLEYMSPEQASLSGLDIDTRSDIYSLGVLLYELLTGSTPLERHQLREAGYVEVLRRIREEEPPPPSARLSRSQVLAKVATARHTEPAKLPRLVCGELDWIAMKCLEKDRTRRYETATDLAADVQHYLDDETVRACPPTAWYRASKFARRHKAAVAIITATGLALLLGVAILAASNAAIAQEHEQTIAALAAETRAKVGLSESLTRERLELYYQRIARAEREWSINNLARAEELLGECPADLRGWEWHYLKRLRLGNLIQLRHIGPAISVAISPDGHRLASGDTGGTITLWDTATWKAVCSLRAHEGLVQGLSFSPDGRRLASASLDRTVRIWDTGTWQRSTTFRGHTGGVLCLEFSPDGRRIASAGEGNTVKVWNATDGGDVLDLPGHLDAVLRLAFSPDGRRLATASADRTVRIWELAAGRAVLIFRGHDRMVRSLAFSPDGRQIASADGTIWKSDDGVVKLWDASTGEHRLTLHGHVGEISALAFSPDGRRLASGGADQILRLWDVMTGREALILRGHSDLVTNLAFSSDGRRLASTSMDQTVRVWDANPLEGNTGRELLTLAARSGAVVRGIVFSPDGRRLASAGTDNTVRIWEVGTWKELLSLGGHTDDVSGVAFSRDGRRLASSSGRELLIWDAETGQRIGSVPGAYRSAAFSPDGKRIASAVDLEVRILDAQTGEGIRVLQGHESLVLGVTFSPDGRLASASGATTVRIWDPETGRLLRTLAGHAGRVCALAFSPDGRRLASASLDRTVRIWEPRTGTETLSLRDPSGGVLGVTYSPDGKRLAWASMDGTVKVWDGAPGSELLTLRGHSRWVSGAAFSPDGRLLASASADGTVKVWDASR